MTLARACLGVDVLVALFWVFLTAQLIRMKLEFNRVGEDAGADAGPWPKVSILVPARDEEGAIETALRSLLSQDYPDLEVVAIDDRSTDATGRIMDRLRAEDSRLSVVHVENLPPGWLGKNNANHQGAVRARGQWLLFTDGDVVLSPDALRRAMTIARRYDLGHIVVLPRFVTKGYWEAAFVSEFCMLLSLFARFWDLRRPGTRAYIGSGTFNLMSRESYDRVGGHERLRMEVADDMKLGLLLRRNGVRQGAVQLEGAVAVRWQPGFRATVQGLFKNAFAGMEWRWELAAAATLGLAWISLTPLAILSFAPSPAARLGAVFPIVLPMVVQGLTARHSCSGRGLEGLVHPLMALTFMGVILWSALSATRRGGISWRGTFYPLAELRAGCVRDLDWPVAGAVGWPERRGEAVAHGS
ncbi:MAG: glycosyltransferase [Elusimicrobiota bacterium]